MWTLDSTRIYVTDYEESDKQILAKLNPIGGGTVYHTFGYEDFSAKIEGYIVGPANIVALRGMVQDNNLHLLIGPYSISGWFYVDGFTHKLMPTRTQTLDTTQDCEAQVRKVSIELSYENV